MDGRRGQGFGSRRAIIDCYNWMTRQEIKRLHARAAGSNDERSRARGGAARATRRANAPATRGNARDERRESIRRRGFRGGGARDRARDLPAAAAAREE
jgi:hypothetical protein